MSGFLHLVVEEGFAGGDHDAFGLCFEVVDNIFPIQSSGNDGVFVGACLLNCVQVHVQIDELLMHLIKILAKSSAKIWSSCCRLEVVEAMDRLVSGYHVE
jgi:hypothetical protein